jgi:hypothetical protein
MIVMILLLFHEANIVSTPSSPTPAAVDCPEGPFETNIDTIARGPLNKTSTIGQQTDNDAVPIEIARIAEGGVLFVRGGLMNQGMMTWYAIDLERHIFVAVLRSTNPASGHIPSPEKLGVNQTLRSIDAGGQQQTEYVTVVDAQPAQVRTFACLANKLLSSDSEPLERPQPADVMKRQFSLLHNGKALDLGEGRTRWEIEGELTQFMSQPLQEMILRAL